MLTRCAEASSLDTKTVTLLSLLKQFWKTANYVPSLNYSRLLKLTVGSEKLRFNHELQMEAKSLSRLPVIQIVDQATRFDSASLLRKQLATET